MAVSLAPQYAEALYELQGSRGGSLQFHEELRILVDWSGPLVPLYENEQQLNGVLALEVMDEQAFRGLAQELAALTPDEGRGYMDQLIADEPKNEEELDRAFDGLVTPKSPQTSTLVDFVPSASEALATT